uniref:DDE-type integrase/transposase/recombinase n=1 Tax=Orbus sturtevantii TaxID=3074109 RepID=UPI00370D57D6
MLPLASIKNGRITKLIKTLFPNVPHITQQYANNSAENSHQPTRLRERKMRKFKSLK